MQRYARVEDVLDDQQVAAVDRLRDVLDDLNLAAGLGAIAVAGHDHEIHVARRIDRTGQVGHEDVRALEDADDQRILAAVILSDARAKLADLVSQLLLGEIYFLNIVSHVISHFVSSSQSLFPAARRFPAFG